MTQQNTPNPIHDGGMSLRSTYSKHENSGSGLKYKHVRTTTPTFMG